MISIGQNINYEYCELPSYSDAKLIQVLADPKELKRHIEQSEAYQGNGLK